MSVPLRSFSFDSEAVVGVDGDVQEVVAPTDGSVARFVSKVCFNLPVLVFAQASRYY